MAPAFARRRCLCCWLQACMMVYIHRRPRNRSGQILRPGRLPHPYSLLLSHHLSEERLLQSVSLRFTHYLQGQYFVHSTV